VIGSRWIHHNRKSVRLNAIQLDPNGATSRQRVWVGESSVVRRTHFLEQPDRAAGVASHLA
jgi:hypothetical protein